MLEALKKDHRAKMDKVIEDLHQSFGTIRTGRASLSLLDHIQIQAYGAEMSLIQVASLSTPDARTIVIQPFDPSQIRSIEKALQASDLGITPSNDGRVIRLNVPSLTEDRRKELVKLARKYAEEHRVSIRLIRHQYNDQVKKMQKESQISEDQMHVELDLSQKITDECISKVDKELEKKETEIMEV
ncbi:ribosome recycling factor [bacterium]|nr:ribosome recycling factor [bacterium]